MPEGLPPVYHADAKYLILGSFPGVRSLTEGRYYAHPHNAFWPLMAAIWPELPLPEDYAARLAWLRERRLALWDVYAACERPGSLDAAIRQARHNDLGALVAQLPRLEGVVCNGNLSYRVASRLLAGCPLRIARLPSTSPAHAGMRFEQKLAIWRTALRGTVTENQSGAPISHRV